MQDQLNHPKRQSRAGFPGLPGLKIAGSVAVALLALTPIVARGGLSHSDYLEALQKAEAKAERTRPATSSHPVSETGDEIQIRNDFPLVRKLFGRTYRVGDSWTVAAFAESSTMARKSDNPADLPHLRPTEEHPGHAGIFHYEVAAINVGIVTLRVTQLTAFGLKPVDPRVQWLSLSFDSRLIQREKTYQLAGNTRPIAVSPEGVHSRISRLELFPLDAPDLTTAEQAATPKSPPLLPEPLAAITGAKTLGGSLSGAIWFQQDDFFGRPIRALWRPGDPWPAYLSTINGVAVLL